MVGDGLTAKLALINLAKENFKLLWIREQKDKFDDKRTTLLTHSSLDFLKKNNFWDNIKNNCHPTNLIKIAPFNHKNFTELKNEDNSPLAWLVNNQSLDDEIQKQLKNYILLKKIIITHQKIKKIINNVIAARIIFSNDSEVYASLIIGADGSESIVRKLSKIKSIDKSVSKKAIICKLKHKNISPNTSWQRFLNTGTIALLSMKNIHNVGYSSMVWMLTEDLVKTKLKLSKAKLEQNINDNFGESIGKLKIDSDIMTWKLKRIDVPDPSKNRCVLIGDAAHTIYPLTGQGFNLSIGDIRDLTQEILFAKKLGLDYGDNEILERYKNKRKLKVLTTTLLSDGFDWVFTSSQNSLRKLGQKGMIEINKLNFLKKIIINSMSQI